MDRYGSVEHDTAGVNDAAIEAPPAIGTDERRMHVRAYNFWVSLLDGRAYPSIDDLDPDHPDFGSNAVLLDFSTGTDNPAISFLGEGLATECEIGEEIRTIADVPARSLLSRLTDHYMQIIANRAPIGFEAEYVNIRGNNTMYRGILMPVSSDDDTIDFIYGVINWKEVADEETHAKIGHELQRALDAPVPRDQVAPLPAYADGPSAILHASEASESSAQYEDALDLDTEFTPDGTEALGDWLAAARDLAVMAHSADLRSRSALYRALGLAYDFALVADQRKAEFAELLEESGISSQVRAPMTPIVKLVFGIDYDKTRIAEYAAALTYAKQLGVGQGGFESRVESFGGGLKGFVAASRAERRPIAAVAAASPNYDALHRMASVGTVEIPGDSEFVVLVARRVDAQHVEVIGTPCTDSALISRALNNLSK